MQVRPLPQVLIGNAQGHKLTHSTVGRIAARAIRASMLADLANKRWELHVKNIMSGDAKIYVKPQCGEEELQRAGFHDAPRGTLSHWVVSKDGQIANYQAVVPAGRRDENGTHGRYETSLLTHSFDSCLACAMRPSILMEKKLSRRLERRRS